MVRTFSSSLVYKLMIMTKRFYLKDGSEVKVGSTIRVQTETTTPFGKGVTSVDVQVTEATIPILIKNDVLVAKNDTESILEAYVKRVAIKYGLSFSEAGAYINNMIAHDKFMALYLLLKAASEEAMCGYDGNNYAVIHLHTGRMFTVTDRELPPHTLIFPSCEKAKEAIDVLEVLFGEVYDIKQED